MGRDKLYRIGKILNGRIVAHVDPGAIPQHEHGVPPAHADGRPRSRPLPSRRSWCCRCRAPPARTCRPAPCPGNNTAAHTPVKSLPRFLPGCTPARSPVPHCGYFPPPDSWPPRCHPPAPGACTVPAFCSSSIRCQGRSAHGSKYSSQTT